MVMVKISIISAGLTEMDERLDYTDKSQLIREHDCMVCMVCMACQEICPEGAILTESANQEWHEKAAGTYVMMKSTSVNPHAHD
jgi:ferredoxin